MVSAVMVVVAAVVVAAAAAPAIKFALFLLPLWPSTAPYFLGILTYRGCLGFSS